jgi:lysophospholipase L1-like esterase
MQRVGKFVASTSFVVIALIAFAPAAAVASPGDHPYVALGDSITVGYPWGASAPENSYVSRLYSDYQTSLGADQLLNRAQTGASAGSLRTGGQLTTALGDINAPSDTVAVTLGIAVGSNALSSPCFGHWEEPAVCQYREDFAYIAAQLQTALDADPGSEPFTVLAYYNARSGTGTDQEAAGDQFLLGSDLSIGCSDTGADVGMNDVIYQEAEKLGLLVANAYPPIKALGQAAIAADHVHPNDSGHAALAQAFRDASGICPQGGKPPDTDPPQTMLLSGPSPRTTRTFATFIFKSDEPKSTFICRLDSKPWRSCRGTRTYRHLRIGRHVFRVGATDMAGNRDPTPVIRHWRIRRKRLRGLRPST